MSEAASAVQNQPAAKRSAPDEPQQPAAADQAAAGRVTELRVSAHLMNLEPGLFCVFPAPGSPAPDPQTGLPGVRITPAPGVSRDGVNIATFREDGWLENAAALVRISGAPSQILVSVYQMSQHGPDSAPRLQVLRLTGDAAPPAQPVPQPAAAAAPGRAEQPAPAGTVPEVLAHIQRRGDVGSKLGEWMGNRGSRQWIEGFGLAPSDRISPEDIEYQAVLGRGWLSPWVEGGKFCGSRGMALPLLGLKIRLKGDAARRFDCSYSATFVDGSAVGPVPAGDSCEAESLAALEAFQIELKPRDASGGSPKTRGAATPKKPASRAVKAKAPAKTARR